MSCFFKAFYDPQVPLEMPGVETDVKLYPKAQSLLNCLTGMALPQYRPSCGDLFGISRDYLENPQSLETLLVQDQNATFFMQASGDSMFPSIQNGCILVVDRSLEHQSGRIVIVTLEGELLCKRFFKNKSEIRLVSDNPLYPEIQIHQEETRDFSIWGTVTYSIHPHSLEATG